MIACPKCGALKVGTTHTFVSGEWVKLDKPLVRDCITPCRCGAVLRCAGGSMRIATEADISTLSEEDRATIVRFMRGQLVLPERES